MGDGRLSSLAILRIERDACKNIDFDQVFDTFKNAKAMEINF